MTIRLWGILCLVLLLQALSPPLAGPPHPPPTPLAAQPTLPNYRVFWGKTINGWLVVRRWQDPADTTQAVYLGLNPVTFRTRPLRGLPVQPLGPAAWHTAVAATPYGLALAAERFRSSALQDAGLERADTNLRGFSLTIDRCPSQKPLDRAFFEGLIAAFDSAERPVPVAISLTGLWMNDHPADVVYLKQLQYKRKLAITWVNHTYHHRYDPAAPLTPNFILSPGTDPVQEALLAEQAMLARNLMPSPFFRFPGLVSDAAMFGQILGLGLLPMGSDAWLAKGQRSQGGTWALVHANGNEPAGLADFFALIRNKRAQIRGRRYLLYPVERGLP